MTKPGLPAFLLPVLQLSPWFHPPVFAVSHRKLSSGAFFFVALFNLQGTRRSCGTIESIALSDYFVKTFFRKFFAAFSTAFHFLSCRSNFLSLPHFASLVKNFFQELPSSSSASTGLPSPSSSFPLFCSCAVTFTHYHVSLRLSRTFFDSFQKTPAPQGVSCRFPRLLDSFPVQ